MTTTLNDKYGLTEPYQHDLDETTAKCNKCDAHISEITLKLCPVVGSDEFAGYSTAGDE